MFLREIVLQTACKVFAALGSAFLAAARDLILNQTLPVLTGLIQVLEIKFLKIPTNTNRLKLY